MVKINKNQEKILNLFRNNIFLKTSIRELTKKLQSKSYQRIYESVKEFKKENIIKIEKAGQTSLVSLNLSKKTILYLSFLDEEESMSKHIPNYNQLTEIKEITDFLIIITGSYAKDTYNKKSDLDLVIILPDDKDPVKVHDLIENLTMLYTPKIHLYVFKKKDFISMLIDKQENYGKEIFKNHLILKNSQIYYELLKEAINNGFKY